MTTYAYDAPDELRDDLVPDLRLEATQPWMGLTAYVADRPHLIIGRNGESYIMEDETGERIEVDFMFPWEEPKVETNRIVAASRIEKSPFRDAGLLVYLPDTGEWAVRVGVSNMRFPLEERVAALEANDWKLALTFDDSDVVVPVHGKCPNCGSDSLSYAEDEDDDTGPAPLNSNGLNDGVISAAQDPVVLCHACHQWCKESELATGDDDAGGNKKTDEEVDPEKISSLKLGSTPFSFQGKSLVGQHTTEGIAILPERQSQEEIAQMLGGLAQPSNQMQEYVPQQNKEHGTSFPPSDNPFINRGGSSKTALQPQYPEQFKGGPFICLAKALTPAMTISFADDRPGGRGTDKRLNGFVTTLGGMGSHAVVVAQPLGVPVIVAPEAGPLIDKVQPGDHIRIDGTTGVVAVNGGDPNFVAQDPNSITVDNPIYRFAYASGTGHVEEMVQGQMVGDKGGHNGMLSALEQSGHKQDTYPEDLTDLEGYGSNATYGFICDDGTILYNIGAGPGEGKTPIPDWHQFVQWIHAQAGALGLPTNGTLKPTDISYVQTQHTGSNKLDEALKCTNCGSHTVEAYHIDEEKGKGEFGCLNCGNIFKTDYRKHAADKPSVDDVPKTYPGGAHRPGTRIEMVRDEMKGLRGTVTGHHSEDDIFPGSHFYNLQLDDGRSITGIHETTFKKIKSASFDKTGVIIHTYLPSLGWHFSAASASNQNGLDGTITYPDGSTVPLNTAMGHMMQMIKNKGEHEVNGHFNNIPVTVDTDNPELFWQIWNEEGEGGENQVRTASIPKGAPYPENSYKNAPDHTPKGQKEWPEEVNAIYNACMREGNGDKEKCAKIAWAKYKENDGKPKNSDKGKESSAESIVVQMLIQAYQNIPTDTLARDAQREDQVGEAARIVLAERQQNPQLHSVAHPTLPEDVLTGVDGGRWGEAYEGHPVMCYMCGNERTAALGSQCQHCGYPLMIRRDGPPNTKGWPKSAALEVGNWYSMHSPKYTVPDVIHVKDVNDEGITASIEGDDKGLFPIHLRHDEIESEEYSFEPYTPHVEKTARKDFTATEQKELVNENLSGRARNIHKLELEGTHYPTDIEASTDDILTAPLYWW